ncbi:hydrogenase expression/formation protein HypE [bacterium BFN5]|nr:hydrogenase expression/formation protein HypE [bacterium BFN5]
MKNDRIQMGHGSGGRMSHDLIANIMFPAFNNPILAEMHDGAKLQIQDAKLAFTTDSFIVKPLFFPGGDIGKLAVCGTVNDLAMTGAVPLYLSVAFILEEGFPVQDLQTIVQSIQTAAAEAGVFIVTGDTKVAEKGAVDGIYINTAGIGKIVDDIDITTDRVQTGQDIILSGPIGDHAVAVMAKRHGITLPQTITSDCAPLNGLVKEMLLAVSQISMLRDPTRGGVATTLNEIAGQAKVGILLEEAAIPIRPEIAAVCDMLGLDPLYLANEGKMLAFVDSSYSKRLLDVMHQHQYGKDARIIGKVTANNRGSVGLRTMIGGVRLLDMPASDQLPRIC